MTEFKYIVFSFTVGKGYKKEVPIIFPKEIVHSFFEEACMTFCFQSENWNYCEMVSAGFVDIISLNCYGESETLKLKSRGKVDSKLILTTPYGGGIV